jgi:hypothetical protein
LIIGVSPVSLNLKSLWAMILWLSVLSVSQVA